MRNMIEKAYLAVAMGASSGRYLLGFFDGQRLRLEEVYRFVNGPHEFAGHLHWDVLSQWSQIRQGLCAAGGRIETIHIVGGGTKNRLLCQATADACHRRVVAGPVEATAIGNLLVQAIAAGDAASIAEARDIVRRSFVLDEYEPQNSSVWDDAYQRFLTILYCPATL